MLGNWNEFPYSTFGKLVHNRSDDSMTAHCSAHGSRCRLPKTLRKKGVAYLCYWLRLGSDLPVGAQHAVEHMNIKYSHASFRIVSAKDKFGQLIVSHLQPDLPPCTTLLTLFQPDILPSVFSFMSLHERT